MAHPTKAQSLTINNEQSQPQLFVSAQWGKVDTKYKVYQLPG